MKRTMIAVIAVTLGLLLAPALPASDAGAVTINISTVSYTHLTLPTILLV